MDSDSSSGGPTRTQKGKARATLIASDSESDSNPNIARRQAKLPFNAASRVKGRGIIDGLNQRSGQEREGSVNSGAGTGNGGGGGVNGQGARGDALMGLGGGREDERNGVAVNVDDVDMEDEEEDVGTSGPSKKRKGGVDVREVFDSMDERILTILKRMSSYCLGLRLGGILHSIMGRCTRGREWWTASGS